MLTLVKSYGLVLKNYTLKLINNSDLVYIKNYSPCVSKKNMNTKLGLYEFSHSLIDGIQIFLFL